MFIAGVGMAKKSKATFQILPRVRVVQGERIALGPGKAQLLQGVNQHGSISEASKQLNMSYMRAWLLIGEMNSSFKKPLIAAKRGSIKKGGGAYLTETGLRVMSLYQKINAKCLGAVRTERNQLQKLLR